MNYEQGVWVLLDNYHPHESDEWVQEMKEQREFEQNRAAAYVRAHGQLIFLPWRNFHHTRSQVASCESMAAA